MSENNKNTKYEGARKLLKEKNLEKVNGGVEVTGVYCDCGGKINFGPICQGGPNVYHCVKCEKIIDY